MRGEKEDIKTSEKHRENKREIFPNTRYTIQSKGKATQRANQPQETRESTKPMCTIHMHMGHLMVISKA